MSHDAGAARWLSIHDDLLRGLAHALSNRVGTISAISALLDPGQCPSERLVQGLRVESEQLEAVLHQFRALPLQPNAAPEPLLPADPVAAALSLFAHHPNGRNTECTVVMGDQLAPVLAEPNAVSLALCVALVAVAGLADGQAQLRLGITEEGDCVRFSCSTDGRTGEGTPDRWHPDLLALQWLLASSHGHVEPQSYGLQFELPTLRAARRARAEGHRS